MLLSDCWWGVGWGGGLLEPLLYRNSHGKRCLWPGLYQGYDKFGSCNSELAKWIIWVGSMLMSSKGLEMACGWEERVEWQGDAKLKGMPKWRTRMSKTWLKCLRKSFISGTVFGWHHACSCRLLMTVYRRDRRQEGEMGHQVQIRSATDELQDRKKQIQHKNDLWACCFCNGSGVFWSVLGNAMCLSV